MTQLNSTSLREIFQEAELPHQKSTPNSIIVRRTKIV